MFCIDQERVFGFMGWLGGWFSEEFFLAGDWALGWLDECVFQPIATLPRYIHLFSV
jgi:hypothetical protein